MRTFLGFASSFPQPTKSFCSVERFLSPGTLEFLYALELLGVQMSNALCHKLSMATVFSSLCAYSYTVRIIVVVIYIDLFTLIQ